ncbi:MULTISPECIES: H-NS family histone-like protein [Vibrio harveyi group]|uniref:DNA-binding protein H-NS-like N-terminal domain-containing protein n=1 Tax=Vibrio owensii CAIM 1854 = LMG 25443 TaxID=1229493 RepID=A0A0C1VTG7_9VIBR|nr:hypothetical protein [Vibrio owensii]KIF53198.1 hypothetical protein H735_09715 [Vibrio owensii CAIM 1854 = LMG 25443]
MSHVNHTQNSTDDFNSDKQQSGELGSGVENLPNDQSGKGAEQASPTAQKRRKRSNTKIKHVFNNRNMLNSQMQKASLAELKSASEALTETIKTREEEEQRAKEKLEQDRAAAERLLEQAKAGGIDPAVLAEVFAS